MPPDVIEPDLRNRLNALTEGAKLLVSKIASKKTALRALQDFERALAIKSHKLQEEVLDPGLEEIQKELFSRELQ